MNTSASGTDGATTSDNNANMESNCRGAIPKVRMKRSNNNIEEDRPQPNGKHDDVLYIGRSLNEMHLSDEPRNFEEYSSESSTEDNELLSISDDGCIYTYKGDQIADLPSSFFNLESVENPEPCRAGATSPEMDFLEMDFDPGPSGDVDSESTTSNPELDDIAIPERDTLPMDSTKATTPNEQPSCSKHHITPEKNPITNGAHQPESIKTLRSHIKTDIETPWSCLVQERTRAGKSLRVMKKHYIHMGERMSPVEGPSALNGGDTFCSAYKKIMIWNQQEAALKQINQIGASACGATAVLNVLNALRVPVPTLERLHQSVNTSLRANSSPLSEYLQSRSKAGCTHREIIAGLYELSDKKVYARFFAMYPERIVNLYAFLGYWISKGAVPIATINLQKCEGEVPDSWHHQMIYGVCPEGVYLTNPLECVEYNQLWPQLSSESVLLVRTEDVITRWNLRDLHELTKLEDVRWRDLNVIGQIARVTRERFRRPHPTTSHIKIPASYKAGITLALDMASPAFPLLRQCPELPLLDDECGASAFIK